MKKNIVLIALVFCLAFVSPGIANTPITVYVDGKYLNSDVPPQNIDGRVMVPLRAVSESLGCNVEWNANLNQVNITSNSITPQTIEIIAPDNFKTFINEVFNKMDEKTLLFVTSHIDTIYYEDPPAIMASDTAAEVFPERNNYCHINGTYYQAIKPTLSNSEMIYGYIGYMVHEANHLYLRHSGTEPLYSDQDQEALCDIAALKAIDRSGGKNSAYYGQFKKSLDKELKY